MSCKRCAEKRQRSLEKRRELMKKKYERLMAACQQGDERSCRELHNLNAAERYRETSRFKSEHHRRV